MKKKHNEEDFQFFAKCCAEWIDELGMNEWRLEIKKGEDEETTIAWTNPNTSAMAASISYNTNNIYNDKFFLKSIALHEVLHIFFAHMSRIAASREFSEEEWDRREHEVINKLISCITSLKE